MSGDPRIASSHPVWGVPPEKASRRAGHREPAMTGDRTWAAALRSACEHPEAAAAAWRAGGGQVVGLLGWSAPRELVSAADMLPVRLSPERLAGLGPGRGSGQERAAAAAFDSELTPATAGSRRRCCPASSTGSTSC